MLYTQDYYRDEDTNELHHDNIGLNIKLNGYLQCAPQVIDYDTVGNHNFDSTLSNHELETQVNLDHHNNLELDDEVFSMLVSSVVKPCESFSSNFNVTNLETSSEFNLPSQQHPHSYPDLTGLGYSGNPNYINNGSYEINDMISNLNSNLNSNSNSIISSSPVSELDHPFDHLHSYDHNYDYYQHENSHINSSHHYVENYQNYNLPQTHHQVNTNDDQLIPLKHLQNNIKLKNLNQLNSTPVNIPQPDMSITNSPKICQSLIKLFPDLLYEDKPFECNHCNTWFKNLYELIIHYDNLNIFKFLKYRCVVKDCPFKIIGFSKKLHLRKHLISEHFDKKQFKITVDDDNEYNLVKELLYFCNNCEKVFNRRDTCQRHQKAIHKSKVKRKRMLT